MVKIIAELKITEENKQMIESEMRRFYGDRYYNEYHMNGVTSAEFENLRKLIYNCIEICLKTDE